MALLLGLVLGTRWLNPLVALPLLFAIIPIYSIYWAGRYQLPTWTRPVHILPQPNRRLQPG